MLAGSAADKVSYEASQYGQGLLTYSILEGMRGLALKDGQYIDVVHLFEHARDEVPELAKNIGGVQVPTLATPGSGGFAIGIVNDKVKIPKVNPKPVFIQNIFLNEATYLDELGLTASLEEFFNNISAKGAEADVVFINVGQYQGAYSLRWLYSINENTIRLHGRLYQGQMPVGDEYVISGNKNDMPALVRTIMEEARKRLNKQKGNE